MVVGGGSKEGLMWAGPLSWDSPRRPSCEELDTFCCTQAERSSGQHAWPKAPQTHTHTHPPLHLQPLFQDSTRVPAQKCEGHKGICCICTALSYCRVNVNTWPSSARLLWLPTEPHQGKKLHFLEDSPRQAGRCSERAGFQSIHTAPCSGLKCSWGSASCSHHPAQIQPSIPFPSSQPQPDLPQLFPLLSHAHAPSLFPSLFLFLFPSLPWLSAPLPFWPFRWPLLSSWPVWILPEA